MKPKSILSLALSALYVLAMIGLAASVRYSNNAGLPNGDESFYIGLVQNLRQNGYADAVIDGMPIIWALLVYGVSFLGVPDLLAARLVGAVSLIPTILGLRYILVHVVNARGANLHLGLATALVLAAGMPFVFSACVDSLFAAVLIWSLICLWRCLQVDGSARAVTVAGLLLGATVLVRPIALMYLPGIFLGLVLFILSQPADTRRALLWRSIGATANAGILIVLLQLPALTRTGTIAFENKNPPAHGVTWVQLNTLAQIQANRGIIPQGQHPEWEDVTQYLAVNGPASLPAGYLERIRWNPALCAQEFVRDLLGSPSSWSMSCNYVALRRIGLFGLLAAVAWLSMLALRQRLSDYPGVFLFVTPGLVYTLLYSGIIFSWIEGRLLLAALFLFIPAATAAVAEIWKLSPRAGRAVWALQFCLLGIILLLDIRHYITGDIPH